jgi:hypothetical protein
MGVLHQDGLADWLSVVMWLWLWLWLDRPCRLVVRVPGYKSRERGFDSSLYQIFWAAEGLERGPLSLVSTIEELLGRNSSGFGPENREYYRRDPSRQPRDIVCPQKLALTSQTSGGHPVGIVRSLTRATELVLVIRYIIWRNFRNRRKWHFGIEIKKIWDEMGILNRLTEVFITKVIQHPLKMQREFRSSVRHFEYWISLTYSVLFVIEWCVKRDLEKLSPTNNTNQYIIIYYLR